MQGQNEPTWGQIELNTGKVGKPQNSSSGRRDFWCPSVINVLIVNHLRCQGLPEIPKMVAITLP